MVVEQRAPSGMSLMQGRWGKVATMPPGEQLLLERLRAAASEAGCRAPDVLTSVFVGLKIGSRIGVYGSIPGGALALIEAVAATVVGAGSEQVLRLHGPIDDAMARRYAAVRLNEFVAAAVGPLAQGKAWFVLADAPADGGGLSRWLDHELHSALHSAGVRALPNLFVLLAADDAPAAMPGRPAPRAERGWLWVPLRRFKQPALPASVAVPPVGYQRQLLQCLLTGPLYRKSLRSAPRRPRRGARYAGLARRWLAASTDAQGRGLWRAAPAANARRALLALERCRRN